VSRKSNVNALIPWEKYLSEQGAEENIYTCERASKVNGKVAPVFN
jgi:hypothetical protein